MKLFVTGGTGFIGRHFLGQAVAAGHEVQALRRTPPEPQASAVNWVEGTMRGDHHAALSRCDVVIHFAAAGVSPQPATWEELFATNVTDSLHIWKEAAEAGVARLVVCGSCFEYGHSAARYDCIPPDAPLDPANGYGASKAAATMAALGLARERGFALTLLRPFHVFGDGQHEANFWPALRRAALAGEDFPMTAGEQIRDFTPVEEVARAFLAAATADPDPGAIRIANLGTGQPQTLRTFAEAWWRRWQAAGSLRCGALPYRPHEVMRYVPSLP